MKSATNVPTKLRPSFVPIGSQQNANELMGAKQVNVVVCTDGTDITNRTLQAVAEMCRGNPHAQIILLEVRPLTAGAFSEVDTKQSAVHTIVYMQPDVC